MRHARTFVIVLEVETDDPDYDRDSMACWIDAALDTDSGRALDSTVYDTLGDLLADLQNPDVVAADPLLAKVRP